MLSRCCEDDSFQDLEERYRLKQRSFFIDINEIDIAEKTSVSFNFIREHFLTIVESVFQNEVKRSRPREKRECWESIGDLKMFTLKISPI